MVIIHVKKNKPNHYKQHAQLNMSETTANNDLSAKVPLSTHTNSDSRCKKNLFAFSKYFYIRTCLELSTTVYIAVQYNKSPELPELYAALTHVIDSNPVLALQVYTDEENVDINANYIVVNGETVKPDPPTNVYAAQVDSIDFAKLIKVDKHLDINDPATHASLIERRFEFGGANKPLWEVLLLKDNYLVFKYDHTFFDGIAGIGFHNKLISFLNEKAETLDLSTAKTQQIYYPKQCTDPEDLGMMNVYGESGKNADNVAEETLEKETAAESVPASSPENLYECKKYLVQKNTFTNNLMQVKIPQKDVLKLIKVCKNNGSFTMNTLICSLVAVASKNAFGIEDQSVQFVAPSDIRAQCNLDPDQIGLMVKPMNIATPLLKDELVPSSGDSEMKPLWDFANTIHNKVVLEKATRDGIENIAAMDQVDLLSMIKGKEGKTTDILFGVTNLGLQFQEYSSKDCNKVKYYVRNCIFSQSGNYAFAFMGSAVSTLDSGTNLHFTFPNSVKKESEQAIFNFESYLKALLSIADV